MSELPKLKPKEEPPPGFIGYDSDGYFIHMCQCGEWGAFSKGYLPREGKYGVWYCREHKPR